MQQINRNIFLQTNKRSDEKWKATRYHSTTKSITVIVDKVTNCAKVRDGKIEVKISIKS